MIEIVTLAIALHDVNVFFVVDVTHLITCVRAHAFAMESEGVSAADAIGKEST